MDAEAWLVDERRIIASGAWVAPAERHHQQVTSRTLDSYAAAWLQTGNSSPGHESTTKRCSTSTSFRRLAISR